MSDMTTPGLFVQIGSLLNIQALIICIENDSEEHWAAQFSIQLAKPLQIIAYQSFIHTDSESNLIKRTSLVIPCGGVLPIENHLLYRANLIWVVPEDKVSQSLSSLPLTLLSNVLVYHEIGEHGIEFHEVYKVKGEAQKRNFFALWQDGRLQITDKFIWNRRSNLSDVTLKNSYINASPYFYLIQEVNTSVGFYNDIFDYLKDQMHFRLNHEMATDGQFGTLVNQNGTLKWTGMVGALQEQTADVSGAGLTINYDRGNYIDFSFAVFEGRQTLNMVNLHKIGEAKKDINVTAYIKVFSVATWLGLALAAVGLTIGLCAISVLQARFALTTSTILGCLIQKFLDVVHVMIQREMAKSDSKSAHMLTFVSEVFAFILFSYYCADLTATMTAREQISEINSFNDIVGLPIKLHVFHGSNIVTMFAQARKGTVLNHIYEQQLVENDAFTTRDELLMNPKSGYWFGTYLISVVDDRFMPLHDFEDDIVDYLGIGFVKDSEFKPLFDYWIIKMHQTGMLEKLKKTWLTSQSENDWSHRIFQEDPLVLGFDNLFFPTGILVVGLLVTVFLLFAEKMCHRKPIKLGSQEYD